jgi:hypothetical protein
VFKNLSASVIEPPNETISDIGFTIRNGGGSDIGHIVVRCVPNAINTTANVHIGITGGPPEDFPYGFIHQRPPTEVLRGGGDAMSDRCFPPARIAGSLSCGDLTVFISYALVSQPDVIMKKRFRFATSRLGDHLTWLSQPVNFDNTACK